jgi:hypothetical protein
VRQVGDWERGNAHGWRHAALLNCAAAVVACFVGDLFAAWAFIAAAVLAGVCMYRWVR